MSNPNDLRRILFESINDVKNGNITTSQAKQIMQFAQTLINLGKVELDYMRYTKKLSSSFLELEESQTKELNE